MSTVLWVILIGLGLWWLFRVAARAGGDGSGMGGGCCGGGGHSHHGDHGHEEKGASHHPSADRQIGEVMVDPVCRMTVDARKTNYSLEYGGSTYHFCSSDCYEKFKADPEGYVLERPHPAG